MDERRPELLQALNALYESRGASGNRVGTMARDSELVK
jgi:hypothetical protein